MNPAPVKQQKKEPSKGSQFLTMFLAFLVVFIIGAAFFKLTGSVM